MNTETARNGIFCQDMQAASAFERAVLFYVREKTPVGIIITDMDLRIICWNLWMETHTGRRDEEVAGQRLFEVFPDIPLRGRDRFFHMALDGQLSVLSYGIHHHLIPIPSGDGQRVGDLMPQAVRIYPLENGDRIIGTLTRIEDVTDRVRREKEMQTTIEELRQSLKQVRTLSGMLPICANCKKVRDDKGYWNQVEAYISSHSEVQFSHSICPECAKKLYPDYYDVMYPDEKSEEGRVKSEKSLPG